MVMPWQCECGHWNSDGDNYCEKCQPEKWKKFNYITLAHKETHEKLKHMKKIIFEKTRNMQVW
jgi:hypothetical protein